MLHGGMAQNVGPILEMVTEKYLLRSETEWTARHDAISLLNQMVSALRTGEIPVIGKATHQNFHGPLQKIIPWCTNAYTEELITRCQAEYGQQFHGFWVLGCRAGGGLCVSKARQLPAPTGAHHGRRMAQERGYPGGLYVSKNRQLPVWQDTVIRFGDAEFRVWGDSVSKAHWRT